MAATVDIGSEHQDLLQLLYSAPVGLVHASMSGDIELINAASAGWLLPLTTDGKLDNLFKVLAQAVPGLRETVEIKGQQPGVILDHHRIELKKARRRGAGSEFIAMTLTKLDDRRLMAVFNDITQQVRDQRALSDSDAHYRAVVSVLSEGIVLHDRDGRLLMFNAAAERIVGAPLPTQLSGEAMALSWAPHWPDGRPMSVADTPTGLVLAGAPAQEHVPVYSVSPTGEQRCFEVSALPVIRPGSGDMLGVVTSFTDVTQRQKLQEELHHHREHLQELVVQRTRELQGTNQTLAAQQSLLRAVADAVPGMIGYWDAQLRCRFSNRAYLDWFGKSADAMNGIHMQDLLGAELYALNQPYVEAALQGQPQHFQRAIRKPDGSVGHTLASYIPDVAEGTVRGFNAVVSDVTELKQAELRLERLNEQLVQRALQADEATKAKSAFLANMSHEIRTPMNAIIGLAHLMRREALDPVQQSRLHKISDASQHLLQLINDILDLSKIEAGKMTLDDAEFATQDLLVRVVGLVSGQARDKALALLLDCDALPRTLRGDAVRLSQCLINLLSNAVKFTQRGSVRLLAQVQVEDEHRHLIRFEVQDTGPGIAPDRLGLLFSAFEQADSSPTRLHGGTGLGLALTRHFARLMGGDAGVSSEVGVGSRFWFTAWLGRVSDSPQTPAALFRGLRALLVDDQPAALTAFKLRLSQLGLAVDAELGGPAGLRTLAATMAAGEPYDLVLIEHAMQPADGFSTLAEFRQLLGAGTPPCMLLTSSPLDAVLQRMAQDAGFDAVLVRPASPSDIESALVSSLKIPPRQARGTPDARLAVVLESEDQVRRQLAGRLVLLVEDNPINREVAVDLLRLVGLVVDTAHDGERAVDMMQARRYDIVLMDVQMPGMDGLTATREIRRLGHQTPIVAMTANAFGEERAACLAAGMNHHVAKPVDPALLYSALLHFLADRSAVNSPPVPVARVAAGPIPQELPALLMQRLAAVQGLDPAAGLRAVGGKLSSLEKVLLRFAEVYANGADAAAFVRGEASVERLKAMSHSLRGACAAIGAIELQSALARFEQALAAEPDIERHQAEAATLEAQLGRLVSQLCAALGR